MKSLKQKKVFSIHTELFLVSGAHKVLIDIHNAIKDEYNSKIVGSIPLNKVNKDNNINGCDYIQFKNIFMFYNSIVVIHERKLLALFWFLKYILFQKIDIVYIHHNIFDNLRFLTILPKTIVSISDKSTENLINYFGAKPQNIHKIFNTVKDCKPSPRYAPKNRQIVISLMARISDVKRQVDIYKHLKDVLHKDIIIQFAGIGEQYEELKQLTKSNTQFRTLGFVSDINSLILNSDYIMLFSQKEGLPISLIEAAMFYTPIICNDVGGNTEIAKDGENGFIVNEWRELIEKLNTLPNISNEEYLYMANRSREIYLSNFTFDKFKDCYLHLFSQL